jgi:DNA-binding transcriptional LysR family regulator
VHLGLVCYPRRLPGLIIDLFRHERLVLVCHPRHPLAACRFVTFSGLTGQDFVAWTEIRSSPFMKEIPNNLRHHFKPAHEFHEVEMVKRVVEMGAGIAILPEAVVRPEVAGHVLAAVPFDNGGCTEPLGVIYREDRKLSPAMTQFIQFLKQPEPGEKVQPHMNTDFQFLLCLFNHGWTRIRCHLIFVGPAPGNHSVC